MTLTTDVQRDEVEQGDAQTLTATFTDTAGDPVDPQEVTLTIREPGRPEPAPITKTKGDAELGNPSTGVYTFVYQANTPGTVLYDFFGETTVPALAAKRARGELTVRGVT